MRAATSARLAGETENGLGTSRPRRWRSRRIQHQLQQSRGGCRRPLLQPRDGLAERGPAGGSICSHAFWQQQFAADPAIIGRAIRLNNRAFTVVGVLPDTFDFTAVFAPGLRMDFFVPIILDDIRTYGHMLAVMGRLKPGVTAGQAQAEVTLLLARSKAQNPNWLTDIKTTIVGLKEYVSGKLRRSLIVLWCGVGLILLIVCVNLSNLLLARAATRSKEFAMRSALGAGRGRLILQLLTESLVLSGAGALLGLGFAFATTRYLAHQGSIALPLLSSVRVDDAALTWTLLIAVATAVLFGLVPGLRLATDFGPLRQFVLAHPPS
jgi:ABC-type antimicrobial peptide transport system permease subunit